MSERITSTLVKYGFRRLSEEEKTANDRFFGVTIVLEYGEKRLKLGIKDNTKCPHCENTINGIAVMTIYESNGNLNPPRKCKKFPSTLRAKEVMKYLSSREPYS